MNVDLLEATERPAEVICTAARNDYSQQYVGDCSFEEVMEPVDGDTIQEKKENLIGHMLQRGHFGPTEHVSATFTIEGISRSCMAQITRHRHASFDVQSMRYVRFDEVKPGQAVVEIPELSDPGLPGRNAEFGGEFHAEQSDDAILLTRQQIYWDAIEHSFARYQELLDWGVAPEHARMVLPIGTEVNLVVSLNARMLMHLFDMRTAADAQGEIQEVSGEILQLSKEWCPGVFEYYEQEMQGRKNRLGP